MCCVVCLVFDYGYKSCLVVPITCWAMPSANFSGIYLTLISIIYCIPLGTQQFCMGRVWEALLGGGANKFSCKGNVHLSLVMWLNGLYQNLMLHLQSVTTFHLSKMCALKVLETIKGICYKYCVAANTVSSLVGKGFAVLAGPLVTVSCFLESHKRNTAVIKVNSKIWSSWRVGKQNNGWHSLNMLHMP